MFVIMCGYPGSGKSLFLDLLKPIYEEKFGELYLVRPGDWHPDADGMTDEERTQYNIACWEHALDKTTSLLTASKATDLIILDTCGASPDSLRANIAIAEMRGHITTCIWMATPKSVCEDRIDSGVVQRYVDKIKSAVLEYHKRLNRFFIIKHGTIQNWEKEALRLTDKLCQDDLVPPVYQ